MWKTSSKSAFRPRYSTMDPFQLSIRSQRRSEATEARLRSLVAPNVLVHVLTMPCRDNLDQPLPIDQLRCLHWPVAWLDQAHWVPHRGSYLTPAVISPPPTCKHPCTCAWFLIVLKAHLYTWIHGQSTGRFAFRALPSGSSSLTLP